MVLLQPSSASLWDPWVSVAQLGGEGRKRESSSWKENSHVCISYCGMVCCSLGVCWKAGMFLVECGLSRKCLFSAFLRRFYYVCDVTIGGIWPAKTFFLYCAVFVRDIEVILPKMKLFL